VKSRPSLQQLHVNLVAELLSYRVLNHVQKLISVTFEVIINNNGAKIFKPIQKN